MNNTKYEVIFSDGDSVGLDLKNKIRSIQLHSEWGRSSVLKLALTLTPEQIKNLKLNSIPKGLQLTWDKKSYFKGEATHVQVTGHTQVLITYQDPLHRIDKMHAETPTKNQKLNEFIKKLLAGLKPAADLAFYTDKLFDEELPSFSLGYRNIREILDELADYYGFAYFIHPEKSASQPKLCFLRAGCAVTTQPTLVQLTTPIDKPITSHCVDWKYDTITVGLSDGFTENKKKQLNSKSFQQSLSLFKSGDSMKESFEITLSELDIHVSHPELYDRAEKILPYQTMQKSHFTDSKTFSCFEPSVQIGDSIQIKDPFSKYQDEAIYIVQSTQLDIGSSQPRLQVFAVRP